MLAEVVLIWGESWHRRTWEVLIVNPPRKHWTLTISFLYQPKLILIKLSPLSFSRSSRSSLRKSGFQEKSRRTDVPPTERFGQLNWPWMDGVQLLRFDIFNTDHSGRIPYTELNRHIRGQSCSSFLNVDLTSSLGLGNSKLVEVCDLILLNVAFSVSFSSYVWLKWCELSWENEQKNDYFPK